MQLTANYKIIIKTVFMFFNNIRFCYPTCTMPLSISPAFPAYQSLVTNLVKERRESEEDTIGEKKEPSSDRTR